jgi:hypothetical protein
MPNATWLCHRQEQAAFSPWRGRAALTPSALEPFAELGDRQMDDRPIRQIPHGGVNATVSKIRCNGEAP